MSDEVSASTILFPPWKELIKIALRWDYGSMHTHMEIATILTVQPKTTEYYHMVSRANEELLMASKMLRNVIGKGYEVVNPNDYPETSQSQMDKALRHTKTAELICTYAPTELMDDHHKKIHEKHTQAVVGSRIMLEKETKTAKRLLAMTPARLRTSEQKSES
jgi:hypothetical protein